MITQRKDPKLGQFKSQLSRVVGLRGGRRSPRFRQTAYFNPRIITDARGEAKVSFNLPIVALLTMRLGQVLAAILLGNFH